MRRQKEENQFMPDADYNRLWREAERASRERFYPPQAPDRNEQVGEGIVVFDIEMLQAEQEAFFSGDVPRPEGSS